MKKLRLTCSMLALTALVTFSACQKEDAAPEVMVQSFESSAFRLVDLKNLDAPAITNASTTAQFSVQQSDKPQSDKHPLANILQKLNLNDRQKSAVSKFMQHHNASVEGHHKAIKQIHEMILRKANAIRDEYVKAYHAGKISKEDLEAKLNKLKEKVREELKNNEQKNRHMQAIRNSRMKLFAQIESILGPEQLKMWSEWKKSL
jgi:hypothetical protein